MLKEFTVRTREREQLVDVTAEVRKAVAESGVRSGTALVFAPHTTAAVTINENADPTVCSDLLQGLRELAPRAQGFYRHSEGNSDAHIKSSLVGASELVIVENSRLVLGTWQAVYFAEFDGPRSRRLYVKVQGE